MKSKLNYTELTKTYVLELDGKETDKEGHKYLQFRWDGYEWVCRSSLIGPTYYEGRVPFGVIKKTLHRYFKGVDL